MSFTAGLSLAASVALTSVAVAGTTLHESVRDNTLYQSKSGHLSNGAGEWCFAGRTNQGFLRRGLLRFDLSAIPANATVTGAVLTLHHNLGQPNTGTISLHRVLAGWGEGTSNPEGNEGTGTDATPGDATWVHTFFDTSTWSATGGDAEDAASAATAVGPDFGPYAWSDAGMVADIQAWLDDPSSNHGWMLKADESIRVGSAKRFSTRENADPTQRPLLTVTWVVVGDLDGDNAVGASDLATLLGQWGGPGTADLDGDGTVGASDLGVLLGAWSE